MRCDVLRAAQGPHHYLGGRFVPPEIRDKYGLRLPAYPGAAMCVKLSPAAPQEVHAMRGHVTDATLLLDATAAAKVRLPPGTRSCMGWCAGLPRVLAVVPCPAFPLTMHNLGWLPPAAGQSP